MCTCVRCRDGSDRALAELPACFQDLFRGPPGERTEERAARLAVAVDVLAELLEQGDDIALQDAWYALRVGGAELLRTRGRVGEAA